MEPNLDEIKEFLHTPRTFAIVGASTNEEKAGNFVPKFLMERSFKIVPINPYADSIHGIKVLKDLDELNEPVDGAIFYRKAEDVIPEIKKAINKGINWIWLPRGVISEEAKDLSKGFKFVQNKCPKALIETWVDNNEW